MKKLIIPFAVGIGLGLGGSTAAVMFLGGGDAPLTDSLAAAMGEAPADSVAAVDSVQVHADSAAHAPDGAHAPDVAAADTAFVPSDQVPAEPVTVTAMAPVGAEPPAMSPSDLAELFATMQAREAARVLEHMEDMEVQTILGQLGNREAAAILSNLTPERAAVISRGILRGERSTP